MVTNLQYEEIIQKFSSVHCADSVLQKLKEIYKNDIASNRALERCTNVYQLIKLLERRDICNVNDIRQLKQIANIVRRNDILHIIDEPTTRTSNIPGLPQRPDNMYDAISYIIGRDIGYKWKDFARGLKIREGEIDNLEIRYRDVSERIGCILNTYQRTCPTNHFRTNLLRALCEARRKDLSQGIEDIMDNFIASR
ncbi:putative death domain protein [Trypoxylus dichotomus]